MSTDPKPVELTEDEISQLSTACYGNGEYPCCEHYLTKEDRTIYLGAGRGEVIPKGTRQGGEMVDAVAGIVAARVATARREAWDEGFKAGGEAEWLGHSEDEETNPYPGEEHMHEWRTFRDSTPAGAHTKCVTCGTLAAGHEGRIFILAENRDDAIAWCRQNSVKPYAESTVIITTPLACRGHERHDNDRVVELNPSKAVLDEWAYAEMPWRERGALVVDDLSPEQRAAEAEIRTHYDKLLRTRRQMRNAGLEAAAIVIPARLNKPYDGPGATDASATLFGLPVSWSEEERWGYVVEERWGVNVEVPR